MIAEHVSADILVGDSLTELRKLPAESVHTIVSSPPYWQLRDYTKDEKQLGLEPTPELYVDRLAGILAECHRVLRKDGTLWLNLGNTYSGSGKGAVSKPNPATKEAYVPTVGDIPNAGKSIAGWPDKCLIPIAWLVAMRLIQDGWILRADLIWHKPNGMPNSKLDAPTINHEYLFLLTKRKRYFYDDVAIAEPAVITDRPHPNWEQRKAAGAPIRRGDPGVSGDVNRAVGEVGNKTGGIGGNGTTRHKRSVWTVNTYAYAEAHFATFPPKLIEPCILAGTSEKGCCPACGSPWRRVMERPARPTTRKRTARSANDGNRMIGRRYQKWLDENPMQTLGWEPGCTCDAGEPVPCTVLDPFAGSGTTGLVSIRNRRSFVGIELNPDYAAMARRRMQTTVRMDLEE